MSAPRASPAALVPSGADRGCWFPNAPLLDSDVENSALQSDHDGMQSAARSEFRQDALHMRLDCAFGNRELGGDQLIRFAGGNALQYFDFALSQNVVDGVFGDVHGDLGGNVALAGVYRPYGLEQLLSQHVLEQIA